jgi:hypothetical protein
MNPYTVINADTVSAEDDKADLHGTGDLLRFELNESVSKAIHYRPNLFVKIGLEATCCHYLPHQQKKSRQTTPFCRENTSLYGNPSKPTADCQTYCSQHTMMINQLQGLRHIQTLLPPVSVLLHRR